MSHQRDLALSARSFLRPVTSRRIPLNPDLGYWGGVTWLYQSVITNGAGGGGSLRVDVTPGEGNEFRVMYGQILNLDTTNRVATARIVEPGGVWTIAELARRTLAAGTRINFPGTAGGMVNDGVVDAGSPIFVSGESVLELQVASVAAAQDARFSVGLRVRGDAPTVTEVGNSSPTIDVNAKIFV